MEFYDDPRWLEVSELIRLHAKIHALYGNNPVEEIIETEQSYSMALRRMGIEHRYDDALSKKAGTYRKNQLPPSIHEIQSYLETALTLETQAVNLIEAENKDRFFVSFRGLDGKEDTILRAMNRLLPAQIKLAKLNGQAKGEFLTIHPMYSLQLAPRYGSPTVTTLENMMQTITKSAQDASNVFKKGVNIPFTVIKGANAPMERIVTGAILAPEELDLTTKDPDGKDLDTVGDIYSEEEITKAMYWWMENANQQFSYQHTFDDGKPVTPGAARLGPKDIILLENWQTRVDQTIGDQTIVKGTWMSTARVINDTIWDMIVNGKITGWSVGMQALAMDDYEAVDK